MIYQLKTNFPGFEPITFHSGINIILAKRTNITTNGLGKTLLLSCIDYVLGADYKKTLLLNYPELYGITISLIMDFQGEKIEISRELQETNSKYVKIKEKIVPLKKWKAELLKDKFDYNGKLSLLSWRSLWRFFVKNEQVNNFEYGLKLFQGDNQQKTSVYQSYLLNIAFTEIENDFLSASLKNGGRKLTEYIKNTKAVFEVAPELTDENITEYTEFQESINKSIHKEKSNLYFYQKNIDVLEIKLENLQSSLNYLNDIVEENNLKDLYKVLNDELGKFVKKSFQESKKFHKNLVFENKEVIFKEINETSESIKVFKGKLKITQDHLKNLLKVKQNKLNGLPESSKVGLIINDFLSMPNNQISKEVNEKLTNISHTNVENIKKEIIDKKSEIFEYREFLNNYITNVYEDNEDVEFNLSYDKFLKISFSYKDDSGTGKSSMKLLFYYYFLLILNHRDFSRGIDMMLVDTDFTDGIDSNNLLTFLFEIDEELRGDDCQMIITFREDRNISMEENAKKDWIVKVLTDTETDEGYLFKKNLEKQSENKK